VIFARIATGPHVAITEISSKNQVLSKMLATKNVVPLVGPVSREWEKKGQI
jgi:hypothetical protein